ncbi:PAS domain-containing protein [uncultured Maribacter sp.]|uniref:PAS domain-containing sensor histidine kinase n=1 Tax=uncultured Maribacter sp. TaxID=431308 RepID=UPI002617E5FF|nr:PAS domain-containing protein [uncultured Maribacter sp.]
MSYNHITLVGKYDKMLKKDLKLTNNYLIKQLPKATAFINKKYEVIHASDQWINSFYFDNNDVFGKSIFTLFNENNKDWKIILKNCFIGQPSELFTTKIKDQNNNNQWFEWSNIPWYDDNENVIGAIIQAENITSRTIDELRLKKLETILQEKSEIAKIGTWGFDATTQKGNWCNITKEIHEITDDIDLPLDTMINFYKDGFSRNRISMAIHNAMMKGVSWSEKLQITTANGATKWVVSTGKPIYKNDEFQGLLGTIHDIDNQVHSKIKTKENEHLLKTLIDNLPLNVYIKDTESRKILVNKAECEYMGVNSPDEILGKDDFDFFQKEVAQNFRKEDIGVIKSLKPVLGKETISIKKDGSTTTFLTSKIPLTDNNGDAYGIVGISTDITHLKQKEEELRDLINVTSLQNKKLINFAHIVSHNLRSHTANFSMLLDFLVNEKEETEKESILNMLRNASDNLLDTLDNLNEVVAISSNTNLDKTPINLNGKVESVKQNLSAYIKKNNATLINEIPKNAEIKVIPAYVDSIFMNFITNSVKYKNPDKDPVIKISMSKKDNYSVVSITDNGLGIDLKKYGNKLFGMYKTFHKHKDSRGIGLYITKNQVEAMNGKITVSSKVNKGTTFNIYFNEED